MTYTVFIVQAYQTSQYVVPRGGIFLGKWRNAFGGSSDGKMNVQSACALNTRYVVINTEEFLVESFSTPFQVAAPHCLFLFSVLRTVYQSLR
jgi:hypothetical protein